MSDKHIKQWYSLAGGPVAASTYLIGRLDDVGLVLFGESYGVALQPNRHDCGSWTSEAYEVTPGRAAELIARYGVGRSKCPECSR